MKIGFLIANYNNGGGTERVTSILANGFNNRGYQVSIISFTDGLNPIFNTNSDISLYSIGNTKKNGIIKKFRNFNRLHQIIKKNQIDILIVVDVRLYIYAHWLKYISHCKVIAWEHFNYFKEYGRIGKISHKLAIRYADELIVLGKNDLQNYQQNEKNLTKIDYIYNPFSLETDQTTSLDNNVVLSVGRLEKQKGFDLLLKAWAIVEKKNTNWKLKIIGNGNEKENLLKLKEKLKLKNVDFIPFTKNIINEYLNASLYVMSSRFEGYPLVLIEAQKCGLPIISFNCHEGPSEIVKENVNGFLIDKNDYKNLGNRILYLLNNREILQKFHKNSNIDLDKYELNNILDKWESIFIEIKE